MFVLRFVFCVLAGVLTAGCQQQNEQHAERNVFYRDVKSAAVIVQESYGTHAGISLPFKSVAAEWLRLAGVEVVDNAADGPDCIIRIVAEGEPLKGKYGASGDLFTGARLTGTIRIERPSLHQEEAHFTGRVNPPRRFTGRDGVDRRRPENAPFITPLGGGDDRPATEKDKTAFDGFKVRMASIIGRYFGRSVLLIALDDHASKGLLRGSAIEALAAPGKPSVPYLIDAFLYCSPDAEKGVGEALEKITGEKYGSDAKRWNEWYSRQKQRK